jgi:hypothetical protein
VSTEIGELLGTVEGARTIEVINAFVVQFFSFARGTSKPLLPAGMPRKFSEATVLDKQIHKRQG